MFFVAKVSTISNCIGMYFTSFCIYFGGTYVSTRVIGRKRLIVGQNDFIAAQTLRYLVPSVVATEIQAMCLSVNRRRFVVGFKVGREADSIPVEPL